MMTSIKKEKNIRGTSWQLPVPDAKKKSTRFRVPSLISFKALEVTVVINKTVYFTKPFYLLVRQAALALVQASSFAFQ